MTGDERSDTAVRQMENHMITAIAALALGAAAYRVLERGVTANARDRR